MWLSAHISYLFQLFIVGAENGATGIKGGYGSVSGTVTPKNKGLNGLELESGMEITLGNGRTGKKHFLNRYVYCFALLIEIRLK